MGFNHSLKGLAKEQGSRAARAIGRPVAGPKGVIRDKSQYFIGSARVAASRATPKEIAGKRARVQWALQQMWDLGT